MKTRLVKGEFVKIPTQVQRQSINLDPTVITRHFDLYQTHLDATIPD